MFTILCMQGRNHGWKVEGDQGLGPNIGEPAPRARPKAGLGVGCGRGSPPPTPSRKIFENSYAKSCILVTTCCEISCFLKTTAKKLGETNTLLAPNLKVGGPVCLGPYGCCAYVHMHLLIKICNLLRLLCNRPGIKCVVRLPSYRNWKSSLSLPFQLSWTSTVCRYLAFPNRASTCCTLVLHFINMVIWHHNCLWTDCLHFHRDRS